MADDNRLPTNQSQLDIEAALQDVKNAIGNLNFILNAQNIAYNSNTSVKNKIDAIEDKIDNVDDKIQSGITPQVGGTGEMGLRTVTFPKPFSSVPNVVVVPYHASSPHMYLRACTVQSVSTTGFTFVETAISSNLTFFGGASTTDSCYWIATVN